MSIAAEDYTLVSVAVILVLVLYEWATGKYKNGKKTRQDWQMFALSSGVLAVVERPLLLLCCFGLMNALLPEQRSQLTWIEDQYPILAVVVFILIDEFLHGWAHNFSHERKPSNKFLAMLQAYYKSAHRPHHMNGGTDGKGELNVTQVVVAGWGWMFALPNYWFGFICLYLGLVETWAIGTVIKSIWGIHVHTNWKYDLYLLNHPNPIIAKTMYVLCHVFTFPNQHHQHHSRSKNSARNMNNFLALFDWLFWKKLTIEFERPKIYGWRQTEREANSATYRYFHRSLKTS